jgi:hypothetical protein
MYLKGALWESLGGCQLAQHRAQQCRFVKVVRNLPSFRIGSKFFEQLMDSHMRKGLRGMISVVWFDRVPWSCGC